MPKYKNNTEVQIGDIVYGFAASIQHGITGKVVRMREVDKEKLESIGEENAYEYADIIVATVDKDTIILTREHLDFYDKDGVVSIGCSLAAGEADDFEKIG